LSFIEEDDDCGIDPYIAHELEKVNRAIGGKSYRFKGDEGYSS